MRFSKRRRNVGEFLPVLLRMRKLPYRFKTKTGRLLRVLFVWFGKMRAGAKGKGLLLRSNWKSTNTKMNVYFVWVGIMIPQQVLQISYFYHHKTYIKFFNQMKKAKSSFMVAMSLIFLSGCASLLGIKTPEEITRQQAVEYLLKHDADTHGVVFLKPGYFDSLRAKPFKPGWEAGLRPIQVKLFDSTGQLVFHYSSCEGSLKNTGIETIFPPRNLSPIDSTYSFSDEEKMMREPVTLSNTAYVAVIYWATYTGLPGRNFLEKTAQAFKSQDEQIRILKLNCDQIY